MNRLLLLVGALLLLAGCGPDPTRAQFDQQRRAPMFRVLVYELLETCGTGCGTTVLLFEDEAGTCYITSGVDGGVVIAPEASCETAKRLPTIEEPKQ